MSNHLHNDQLLQPDSVAPEKQCDTPLSYEQLKNQLLEEVPVELKFSVQDTPSEEEVESIIDDANSKAIDALNNAKFAIIRSYSENEKERAKRQKPLLYIVVLLTALQLIAFNLVIGSIVIHSFQTKDSTIILQLFEILKYYIGATVVELIGMIWFITRDTFSSNHTKMMELMFNDGRRIIKDKGNNQINS